MVQEVIGNTSWKLVDFSLLMDVEMRNCEVPETFAQRPATNLASALFRRYDKIMEIILLVVFESLRPTSFLRLPQRDGEVAKRQSVRVFYAVDISLCLFFAFWASDCTKIGACYYLCFCVL